VAQALHICGAHRIGHGCRLREDGDLLHYVVDHRIPLECCPSSNVQTGAVSSLQNHPIRLYYNLGARVTVNTDNRLITDTTVSQELHHLHTQMGFGLDDIKQVIMNGFKSAFMPFHEKRRYLEAIGAELEAFEPDAGRGPVAVDSGASAASG
jgi:adenosine deaminase